MNKKSTIEEIRERFDHDVDRFSDLKTGQTSAVDSVISLELITEAAKRICPKARNLLDIGCGAGNYTLKMLSQIPDLNCTLVDLSLPMLKRAEERVAVVTSGEVLTIQGDIRTIVLKEEQYNIILAGAVLHHLRDDDDWKYVFEKLYSILRPGGCLMISDLITQNTSVLSDYFEERYEKYLTGIGGAEYAKKVSDYIEKEDSPRSLNYQLNLMEKTGFRYTEILHKHLNFAAYCGIK